MAYYYIVAAVETPEGGLTAAVPEGVAWVGQLHTDKTYLIKTATALDQSQVQGRVSPIPDRLITECQGRGLNVQDVLQVWAIGGEA